MEKCEICGEIITGDTSFFALFGQRACSDACMEQLAKKQNKAAAIKTAEGLRLNRIEKNNAAYSSDSAVNNAALWLAEAAKNHRAGKHGYAAKCFFNAVSGATYA